jgi:hypothetical protein
MSEEKTTKSPNKKRRYRKLRNAEDAKTVVDKAVIGMFKVLDNTFKPYEPGTRWILMARSINSVFNHHFRPSVFFGEEQLRKAEDALTEWLKMPKTDGGEDEP